MKKKNRLLSFLLAAAMLFTFTFGAAAFDPSETEDEIRKVYKQSVALYEKNTGRTSFYGYCGVYVSYILYALGIDNYLGGYKGNKWYDAYRDGQKLGEWTVVRIPGADCLQKICDTYEEAKYIVVSYTHQTHYSDENPGAGHVMFINLIKNGVAYFSESYRMYDRDAGEYVSEGGPISMDAAALAEDHRKLYGNAIGALMFVKKGSTVLRSDDELVDKDATSTTVGAIPDYTGNKGALTYVAQLLPRRLPVTVDTARMTLTATGPKTVNVLRALLPELDVTVRGATGVTIADNAKIGTNMRLIVKYQNVNVIFTVSIRGDVSGDGGITSADARTALQICSRLLDASALSEAQRIAFDVNSDGKTNTADARMILRAAAHIIEL